jgi:hypothetical protein
MVWQFQNITIVFPVLDLTNFDIDIVNMENIDVTNSLNVILPFEKHLPGNSCFISSIDKYIKFNNISILIINMTTLNFVN